MPIQLQKMTILRRLSHMFWLFKAWQVFSDNHKLLKRPLYCHVTWAMYLLWIMTSSWLAYLTYMLHAAFWENACTCLTWWIQMTSGSENNELYFTIPGLLILKCLILCSNICRLVFFARTDPFLIILITIVLLYFRFHSPPPFHFTRYKNKMKYLER